jgi:Trk K+ transport system NAD-binding subunit
LRRGKVGGHVAHSLIAAKKEFVMIDTDPKVFDVIAAKERIDVKRS